MAWTCPHSYNEAPWLVTIVKSDSINQETGTVSQGLLLALAENGLYHTDKNVKGKASFLHILFVVIDKHLSVKCQPIFICKQFSNTASCQTFKWHP